MSEFDKALGERLRRYRRLTGFTQASLAAQIGVSFQQVQKYEKGKDRVSASMLMQIAKALQMEPMRLLADGKDEWSAAAPGRLDMALAGTLARCTDRQKRAVRELAEAFAGTGDEEAA